MIELRNHVPSEFAKKVFQEHGYVLRPFDPYSTIHISPNLTNTQQEIEQPFELV